MTALRVLVVVFLSLWWHADSHARRVFVLAIGQATSSTLPRLNYVREDAKRVRDAFGAYDAVLLLEETLNQGDVESALNRIDRAIVNWTPEDLLVVYFAGHGDSDSIHLGRGRYNRQILDQHIFALKTRASRLLMIDACSTRPGQTARGAGRVSLISASQPGQKAYEADHLRGSLFSTALAPALRGAADINQDGQVRLRELTDYLKRYDMGDGREIYASPIGDFVVSESRPNVKWNFRRQGLLILTQERAPEERLRKAHGHARWHQTPGSYTVTFKSNGVVYHGTMRVPDTGTVFVELGPSNTLTARAAGSAAWGESNVLYRVDPAAIGRFKLLVAGIWQSMTTEAVASSAPGAALRARFGMLQGISFVDLGASFIRGVAPTFSQTEFTLEAGVGWRWPAGAMKLDTSLLAQATRIMQSGWANAGRPWAGTATARGALSWPIMPGFHPMFSLEAGTRIFRQARTGLRPSLHLGGMVGVWFF